MPSFLGQCSDLGAQVPCCRSDRASIPHQGNLNLAELAQFVLISYSFPRQVSSFEECRTKCWVGHFINSSQLIPFLLQSQRFHGINTVRIDYEQDGSTMKTCYCESFKHDPDANLPATGQTICALEGPSAINLSFLSRLIFTECEPHPTCIQGEGYVPSCFHPGTRSDTGSWCCKGYDSSNVTLCEKCNCKEYCPVTHPHAIDEGRGCCTVRDANIRCSKKISLPCGFHNLQQRFREDLEMGRPTCVSNPVQSKALLPISSCWGEVGCCVGQCGEGEGVCEEDSDCAPGLGCGGPDSCPWVKHPQYKDIEASVRKCCSVRFANQGIIVHYVL